MAWLGRMGNVITPMGSISASARPTGNGYAQNVQGHVLRSRVRFSKGPNPLCQPCRCVFWAVDFSVMIRVDTQQGITIIELGSAYESLDDDAMEEVGGLILTKATAAESPWVVLDLSGTQYIGSTFIELMVRAWKRLRQRGGNMVLCGVQPFCAEILRATKLDTLWEVVPTREEAVAHATADRQTSEAANQVGFRKSEVGRKCL